jgi:hypothetical protein
VSVVELVITVALVALAIGCIIQQAMLNNEIEKNNVRFTRLHFVEKDVDKLQKRMKWVKKRLVEGKMK